MWKRSVGDWPKHHISFQIHLLTQNLKVYWILCINHFIKPSVLHQLQYAITGIVLDWCSHMNSFNIPLLLLFLLLIYICVLCNHTTERKLPLLCVQITVLQNVIISNKQGNTREMTWIDFQSLHKHKLNNIKTPSFFSCRYTVRGAMCSDLITRYCLEKPSLQLRHFDLFQRYESRNVTGSEDNAHPSLQWWIPASLHYAPHRNENTRCAQKLPLKTFRFVLRTIGSCVLFMCCMPE